MTDEDDLSGSSEGSSRPALEPCESPFRSGLLGGGEKKLERFSVRLFSSSSPFLARLNESKNDDIFFLKAFVREVEEVAENLR